MTTPFADKKMTVAELIAKLQKYEDQGTIIVAHLIDESDMHDITNTCLTREECRILAAHADKQLDSDIGLTNETIQIHLQFLQEEGLIN